MAVHTDLSDRMVHMQCLVVGPTLNQEITPRKSIYTSVSCRLSELQIRGVIENNSKIIFLFLNKIIFCDPSLEVSRLNTSNDMLQHMF